MRTTEGMDALGAVSANQRERARACGEGLLHLPLLRARWNPARAAYATDHLFAVIDDYYSARTAARTLVASGCPPQDVHLYYGSAQARMLEEQERRHWRVRILRALHEMLVYDEETSRAPYLHAVRQGRSVLMVHCPDDANVQRAGDILARAGASHMVYYGRWSIQLVGPEMHMTTGEPRYA